MNEPKNTCRIHHHILIPDGEVYCETCKPKFSEQQGLSAGNAGYKELAEKLINQVVVIEELEKVKLLNKQMMELLESENKKETLARDNVKSIVRLQMEQINQLNVLSNKLINILEEKGLI